MANSKRQGRHCATSRPITPLSGLRGSISKNARRNFAITATTGLAMTMVVMPGAVAAPTSQGNVEANATVAQLSENPTVSVAKDTKWDLDAIVVDRVEKAQSDTTKPADAQTDPVQESKQEYVPAAPAGSLFAEAVRYIGTPYVYGGTTPAGFDCSGYVQYVYRQNGIAIPRTSGAQAGIGTPVSLANARPGDIVSWGYHSAIYAGNGQVLHASMPGAPLGYSPLWGGYTIRRVG